MALEKDRWDDQQFFIRACLTRNPTNNMCLLTVLMFLMFLLLVLFLGVAHDSGDH